MSSISSEHCGTMRYHCVSCAACKTKYGFPEAAAAVIKHGIIRNHESRCVRCKASSNQETTGDRQHRHHRTDEEAHRISGRISVHTDRPQLSIRRKNTISITPTRNRTKRPDQIMTEPGLTYPPRIGPTNRAKLTIL